MGATACGSSEPSATAVADAGTIDAPTSTLPEPEQACRGPDSIGSSATLDVALDAVRGDRHVPGFSVAVVKKGETAFAKGYGVSRAEGNPQTARTIHLLASASKPITAIAILQLAEAGRLRLDDDVNAHVSSLALSVRNP